MTDSPAYDYAIVGGGLVGLALARALLRRHPAARLLLLEKEPALAAHQSGHNSGVIHSGVYYRPGSLKARLCVAGARVMTAFCQAEGVPLRVCGKLIVAVRDEERPALEEIARRGAANGVAPIARLGPEAIRELAADVRGVAALHLPAVAVTDYAAVARHLARHLAAAGAEVRTGAELRGVGEQGGEVVLETTAGAFRARLAANCAGLHADRIARLAGAAPREAVLPFRGEYYALRPPAAERVRTLVYPVPDPRFPFLGVHLTPRVAGGVEAGPNAVLALAREGYRRADFNGRDLAEMAAFPGFWAMAARYWRKGVGEQLRSCSRAAFARALRRLAPGLDAADLAPGGSGVRAQLVARNGRMVDDFSTLRQARWLHVLNAPSPAATASLAIGEHLAGEWIG